jgi:hypothetical protein
VVPSIQYPFNSLHKHYRAIYDAFGSNRLFWGTDITKKPSSWQQTTCNVPQEMSPFSSQENSSEADIDEKVIAKESGGKEALTTA